MTHGDNANNQDKGHWMLQKLESEGKDLTIIEGNCHQSSTEL